MPKIDYLFKRPNSQFWRVRLQLNGKSIERTLKTTDRAQAEIIALPLIAEHKARVLASRPRWSETVKHQPGLHTLDDGQKLFATARELHYLDAGGATIRTEPNRCEVFENVPVPSVVHFGNGPTRKLVADIRRRWPDIYQGGPIIAANAFDRPKVATKNGDDALFETYVQDKKLTGYSEKEARDVWSLFKTMTEGKALKDCTRDDGRLLVKHFEQQGLKSASIHKKLVRLNAAVNLAIEEGKLTFNPFAGIVAKSGKDSIEREPLDDADMALAFGNLDKLDASDQLLFRLLASTGLRLGEAFQITSEKSEKGVRFVLIGTKTAQSRRRVPFPASMLPHLPEKIKGPLFTGDANSASKRLNTFLNECGIGSAQKVVHSLRHRAADRLRAVGAPEDIRWALLGHHKKTADKYGKGFPVSLLRKWIDKIGL